MDFEQAVASLKETLMVMEELERHYANRQNLRELDPIDELQAKMRKGMALHEKRMAHIEQNLKEISDKLNGLIGFMDGFMRGGGRQ